MFATPKTLFGLLVMFALSASSLSAQDCSSAGIQNRLNSGTSVGTILSQCSNLQLSDFYGKTYAGGIIVSLDTDRSGRGMAVAAADDTTNATLTSMYYGTDVLPNTSAEVGTGWTNTQNICARSSEDGTFCGQSPKPRWQYSGPYLYGAYFSATSTRNGYPDWYIPSSGDLTMAFAAAPSAFTSCPSGGWWSSTQVPQEYELDREPGIDEGSVRGENNAGAFSMGLSGNLAVTNKLNGQCVRSFRNFGPWIESATPPRQEQGGAITLTGTNFDPTAANNTVMFDDDHQGVVTSASATQLTFTVPVGVSTGHVRLILNGVYSNSFPITITPAPARNPVVTGFSVPAVVKGDFSPDTITLLGEYFGALNTVVFAGGVSVQNVATSDPTRLNVTVPDGAKSGPVTVSSAGRHGNPSKVKLVVLQYAVTDNGASGKTYNAGAASTDGLHAVAVGGGGLIRVSADGGGTWNNVASYPAVGDTASFSSVVFDTTDTRSRFLAWATYPFRTSFPMVLSGSDPASTWARVGASSEMYVVDMAGDSLIGYFSQSIQVSNGSMRNSSLVWSEQAPNLTGEIGGFATSPSVVVAVGATEKAWWRNRASGSTTWTQVTTPIYQLNDVAFGNGVFAAVGSASGNGSTMAYSTDGKTWLSATCNGSSNCSPLKTVTWNDQWGLFTAYGDVLSQYVSADGRNWVTLTMPTQNTDGTPSGYIDAVNLGRSVLLIEAKGYIVRLSQLVPTH